MCIQENFLNVQREKLQDPAGQQSIHKESYAEKYNHLGYGSIVFWPLAMLMISFSCFVFYVEATTSTHSTVGQIGGALFCGTMFSLFTSWILSTLAFVHDCFKGKKEKEDKDPDFY